MKTVKNVSMQGISVPFGTPMGPKTFFIAPRGKVQVPDSWKSKIAENLVHRRLLKIFHSPDPVAPTAPPSKPSVIKTRKFNK